MLEIEVSIIPPGVITLSSFLIKMNFKILKKSYNKVLVCHYYFYVHQMYNVFLDPFFFFYNIHFPSITSLPTKALGLELCSCITTAFMGCQHHFLPKRILILFPELVCQYSPWSPFRTFCNWIQCELLILCFKGPPIQAIKLLLTLEFCLLDFLKNC